MKRTYKSMLGVTLLEIMLVLAIAALVIVMSIRFYQSASSSQKITATASLVQGIVAAAENYYNGNNNSYTSISVNSIAPYMPGGVPPTTAWGTAISVSSSATNKLDIDLGAAPATACTAVRDVLKTDSRYSMAACKVTYTQ